MAVAFLPPMEPAAIHRALEQGLPLLTATRRLAREWRRRYDAHQAAQGRAVWPAADVLTLDAWIARAWDDALDAAALGLSPLPPAADGAALLSETQAGAVWERIVAESAPARGLLRAQAAARAARQAWRHLAQWGLPLPEPGRAAPLEQRAFAEWARAWRGRCAAQGWADPAHLPDRLAEALRAGLPAPPRLLLAGFEERTPQQSALFEALRAAGTALDELPAPRQRDGEAAACRVALPDAEAEAWAAARWARYWLEREPWARIGIVVPELPARRAQLVRVLEDVLLPAAALPGYTGDERPFNLSQGLPLADYPLVGAALGLLALTPAAQPLTELCALLRSPCLAGAETEREARARLDLRLRTGAVGSAGGAALRPADALYVARGRPGMPAPAPLLADALERWRRAFDALPSRQGAGAWALAFAQVLGALGWPGERPLDSAEHQTRDKWHETLEELARLERVLPPLNRGEALAALRRLANETPFQPEGADALGLNAVQVLDDHEAGGLEFDHLWLLGLHEEAWPPAPRPSAYLPADLQRRHGLPRASLAHALELARRQTARLLDAAPDVVCSHPAAEGERPLRPSPLIATLPAQALSALPGSRVPTLREVLAATTAPPHGTALETLDDGQAPPIAPGTAVLGGTELFQEQAACPFRAFAHHRLHARAPEVPQGGLDARARGTLVHRAQQAFWSQVSGHAALLALDAAALDTALAESVDAALDAFARHRPRRLPPRLEALERRRLTGLLGDWLALERSRAPFVVEQREQALTLDIGGITVTGRVDRIDRLPDGRQVLLDYKTGTARTAAWWGARPDEPQLPLYAASGGFDLAAVAFAQVRRQALRFHSVVDAGDPDAPPLLPGATRVDAIRPPPAGGPYATLAEAVAAWRVTLTTLGTAFRTGDARVDPKRADTCAWCDLPGLCRIAELRPAYGAGLDGEPDEGETRETGDG